MSKKNIPIVCLGALLAATTASAQQPPEGNTRPGSQGTPGSQQGTSGTSGSQQGTTGSQQPGTGAAQQQGTAPSSPHHQDKMAMLETDLSDAQLAAMIHQAHQHEIAMAALASERSESAQVKSLAKQIGADHEKADKALTALAQKKGWDLAGGDATKMQKHGEQAQAMMNEMRTMSGSDFDRRFLLAMQKGHNDTIMMLTAQAYAQPIDKELKADIRKNMPALEKHRTRSIQLLQKEGARDAQASL